MTNVRVVAISVRTIVDNRTKIPPWKFQRLTELMENAQFRAATESLRQQICIAEPILRKGGKGERLTYREVGALFNLPNGASVFHHIHQGMDPARPPHRPSILPEAAYIFIRRLVRARTEERNPVTYAEILELIELRFEIVLSGDTLRHVIYGMANYVKPVAGRPMEEERIQVDTKEILLFFRRLATAIDSVPRRFVFNVDETGCMDYSDRREITVVVPASYDGRSIPIPVSRHTKRSTLPGCIAADGYRMKPFIILARKRMEAEVAIAGYTPENCEFAYQENAFMTKPLFTRWGRVVFFPSLEDRRRFVGHDGPAVLLLDGVNTHCTPELMTECARRNVRVIPFVAHASHILQPLDLLHTLFSSAALLVHGSIDFRILSLTRS
jgi:hypothetical protein